MDVYRAQMRAVLLTAACAMVMLPASARALCIYNGVDNAETSIEQEFRDSPWVVRAKVLGAKDHWSDDEDSWTTYDLAVVDVYKGRPPKRLTFFTFRNSGGFYMDRAWVGLPKGHDVGGEYLLFLEPWPTRSDLPKAARGAVFVNYSCGRSGPWAEVAPTSRHVLDKLRQRSIREPPRPGATKVGFRQSAPRPHATLSGHFTLVALAGTLDAGAALATLA